MKPLLICSKSTSKFITGYTRIRIVSSPPSIDILKEKNTEKNVVAIGGGSVIDTAKILCNKPITCYPTTASGSSATSWAVYWGKENKYSLACMKPDKVIIHSTFMNGLPSDILNYTRSDAISHCLDSLNSAKSTTKSDEYCRLAIELLSNKSNNEDTLQAGHIAGQAIQITGTNLLHSLSYPMSIYYGLSHGEALCYLLPKISEYMNYDVSKIVNPPTKKIDIDFNFVVEEAFKYDKINEYKHNITPNILKDILND